MVRVPPHPCRLCPIFGEFVLGPGSADQLQRTRPLLAATGLALAAVLAGCSPAGLSQYVGTMQASFAPRPVATPGPMTSAAAGLDGLIRRYARSYGVPESLVRRVIVRESGYDPRARNGPYLGLMQISYATARSMGYRGSPSGLLDAETNLKYAVKYLRGAYLVAGGNSDQAMRLYARGYYYDAKRRGLLEETGLR